MPCSVLNNKALYPSSDDEDNDDDVAFDPKPAKKPAAAPAEKPKKGINHLCQVLGDKAYFSTITVICFFLLCNHQLPSPV